MTPVWMTVLSALGGGSIAVFLSKLLDEVRDRRNRSDERTQTIVRAYAKWITDFESALIEWSGQFMRIAWEDMHGKGTVQNDDEDRKRLMQAVRDCQKSCWEAVIFERDRRLANEVVELSRIFDWEPEYHQELTERAHGFSEEAKEYRRRIAKLISDLQIRYLKGWPN